MPSSAPAISFPPYSRMQTAPWSSGFVSSPGHLYSGQLGRAAAFLLENGHHFLRKGAHLLLLLFPAHARTTESERSEEILVAGRFLQPHDVVHDLLDAAA